MRIILPFRTASWLVISIATWLLLLAGAPAAAAQQANASPQSAAATKVRTVGTVKSIAGSKIVLQTDNGVEISVALQPTTKLVRLEPGQTDLKNAPAIQLSDIQVGDRMLAAGQPSDDGKSLTATTAVLMKREDVAEKQQHEREEWQKNGIGGVVKAVDPASGTITLSTGAMGASTMIVHLSRETIIRRYAADSIKFDDAKPGTIEQIKPGDQLRARGTKTGDGKELTAAEIVSGTFRNVAGLLVSTDAANNTITVTDLATKRPVTLTVASDSQMHQLPAIFAQRIAMRLKSGTPGQGPQGSGGPPTRREGAGGERAPQNGGGMGSHGGGPPDFQQMLNRMPSVSMKDLQKGNALMIVATEGTDETPSKVIILLSGVEPILTAASPREASTILSPWNLSAGANEGTGDNP